MATILETPKIHHIRVGTTWVLGGDRGQESDEKLNKENTPLCPFPDSEPKLPRLWDEALLHNKRYLLLRNMVRDGARQYPTQWALPISIFECPVDERQHRRWRDRIWIPDYEPLRTAII